MRLFKWLFRRSARSREWNWALHDRLAQTPADSTPTTAGPAAGSHTVSVSEAADQPQVKVLLGFANGPDLALDDDDALSIEFRRLADAIWSKRTVSSSAG